MMYSTNYFGSHEHRTRKAAMADARRRVLGAWDQAFIVAHGPSGHQRRWTVEFTPPYNAPFYGPIRPSNIGRYCDDFGIEPLPLPPVPDDFPVKVLADDEHPPGRTTCGTCLRSWDDDIVTGSTPAPSARCPFEYYHADTDA